MSVRPWIAGLTWAVLLVATLVGQVRAQEPDERQPAIILSIAPLERSLPDLTYLLSAMNLSEMVGIFELMSAFYTRGCDRTRPIAVQVFFEGAEPEAQICLPLTDLQLWLGAIASLGRGAEELGEGQYELLLAGQLVQARVVNDWLYLVPGERRVASPSGDPATLLGDLPDHYCLGARINPRGLPAAFRDQILDDTRASFLRSLAQPDGQGDAGRPEWQAAFNAVQLEQLDAWMNQTEQLELGFVVRPAERQIEVSGSVRFLPGSELAAQVEAQADLHSRFINLSMPLSSAELRLTSNLMTAGQKQLARLSLAQLIEQSQALITGSHLPPDYVTAINNFLAGCNHLMERAVDEGKLDCAVNMGFDDDDQLRLLAAVHLTQGARFAEQLKELVANLPGNQAIQFEFDYLQHRGFAVHRAAIRLEDSDKSGRLLSDQAELFLAVGESIVLISIEQDGPDSIQAAIDQLQVTPPRQATPFQGHAAAGSLLRLLRQSNPEPILDELVAALDLLRFEDRIELRSSLQPRGLTGQLTIDEGVLRAFGTVIKNGNLVPGF